MLYRADRGTAQCCQLSIRRATSETGSPVVSQVSIHGRLCPLASSVGLNRIINNDTWFESYGPTAGDRRHSLTVSGIVDLPWGLRLSSISTFQSKPPFRAQIAGIDFNGDGTINDLLPGTKWNELNRGLSEADLRRLVENYNGTLAGARTPTGQ